MLKLRAHTSKCLNRALGHLRSNTELLVSEKNKRKPEAQLESCDYFPPEVHMNLKDGQHHFYWNSCSAVFGFIARKQVGGWGDLGCPADLGLSPCVFLGHEARNTQSTRNTITLTSIVSSGIYLPAKGPNGRKACQDQSPEQP